MKALKSLWSKISKPVKEEIKNSKQPVWFRLSMWFLALAATTIVGGLIKNSFFAPDTRGSVLPTINTTASKCAKGFDRALEISFKEEALVDFDRGRLLDWNEYTETEEYKRQQGRENKADHGGNEANLLPEYELALTYRQDDQLLYGHKGFPFVLRRKGIAVSKLLYEDLSKVEVSVVKEALRSKKDGPSPLDDGLWAIRTSDGNLVALEIRGLPPSALYPSTPKVYDAKLYACFYSNSWF